MGPVRCVMLASKCPLRAFAGIGVSSFSVGMPASLTKRASRKLSSAPESSSAPKERERLPHVSRAGRSLREPRSDLSRKPLVNTPTFTDERGRFPAPGTGPPDDPSGHSTYRGDRGFDAVAPGLTACTAPVAWARWWRRTESGRAVPLISTPSLVASPVHVKLRVWCVAVARTTGRRNLHDPSSLGVAP